MKFSLDTSLFSSYRAQLMGISMLGVMVAHGLLWAGLGDMLIAKVLRVISYLAFTQGFLFCSGFGLYYSMSKGDSSLKDFYKRRILRLQIPFMLMSLPFYLWWDFSAGPELGASKFLLDWTSLFFWVGGNNDMWYISVSIFLYALFPFAYKAYSYYSTGLTNNTAKSNENIWLLFSIASCLIVGSLYFLCEPYYKMTMIGLGKIPIFFLGACFAVKAKAGKNIKGWKYLLVLLPLVAILSYGRMKDEWLFTDPQAITVRLLTLPACCFILKFIDNNIFVRNYLSDILKWLGKYSLEIYVLHMMLNRVFETCFPDMTPLYRTLAMFVVVLAITYPVHKGIGMITEKI